MGAAHKLKPKPCTGISLHCLVQTTFWQLNIIPISQFQSWLWLLSFSLYIHSLDPLPHDSFSTSLPISGFKFVFHFCWLYHCQDPIKWCYYLRICRPKIRWLTSSPSCQYTNSHETGPATPFTPPHYSSETTMSSPSITSTNHHSKTWSSCKLFIIIILSNSIHSTLVYSYHCPVYLSPVWKSNQLLPRVSSLHILYSHPGLNLHILKLRHFALKVGTAHKLKLKPHTRISPCCPDQTTFWQLNNHMLQLSMCSDLQLSICFNLLYMCFILLFNSF